MRSLIAAVALLVFCPTHAGTGAAATGWSAVVYAITLVLFVAANKLTTAANAIFLQATAPLYILLAAPWLLREHLRREDVPFMVAVAAGMAAFFVGGDAPVASAPNPPAGNMAAACERHHLCAHRDGAARRGPRRPGATLNTIVVGKPRGGGDLPARGLAHRRRPRRSIGRRWPGWACFRSGWRTCCLSKGVRHVTALEASLLLLAEPVLNPVWAWLASWRAARALGARGRRAHRGGDAWRGR